MCHGQVVPCRYGHTASLEGLNCGRTCRHCYQHAEHGWEGEEQQRLLLADTQRVVLTESVSSERNTARNTSCRCDTGPSDFSRSLVTGKCRCSLRKEMYVDVFWYPGCVAYCSRNVKPWPEAVIEHWWEGRAYPGLLRSSNVPE